jgi:hypothetical protein
MPQAETILLRAVSYSSSISSSPWAQVVPPRVMSVAQTTEGSVGWALPSPGDQCCLTAVAAEPAGCGDCSGPGTICAMAQAPFRLRPAVALRTWRRRPRTALLRPPGWGVPAKEGTCGGGALMEDVRESVGEY